MRKIKEVLRLKWEQGLTNRTIAKSLSIARSTVGEYVRRATDGGLSWPLPAELDEAELERRLFPAAPGVPSGSRLLPDWREIPGELTGATHPLGCQNRHCHRQARRGILSSRVHPQQGFRSCLGTMRLGKHYGAERLEAACARALLIGGLTYKSVKATLTHGLDQRPLPQAPIETQALHHENIRGPHYYH